MDVASPPRLARLCARGLLLRARTHHPRRRRLHPAGRRLDHRANVVARRARRLDSLAMDSVGNRLAFAAPPIDVDEMTASAERDDSAAWYAAIGVIVVATLFRVIVGAR